MKNEPNVYETIRRSLPEMSRSHKKVAAILLDRPDEVVFLNVSQLAAMAEVSDATITRFVVFLGFRGFAEFQEAIQSSLKQQWKTSERLIKTGNTSPSFESVLKEDITEMEETMDRLDEKELMKAVHALWKADKIWIASNRSAEALGGFLHYYLEKVVDDVRMIHSVERDADLLARLGKQDVVIGISFPRYSKSTVDILAYACEEGVETVALTDTLSSPLSAYADTVLTAKSRMHSYIDTFTAPLSVIQALLVQIGREREEETEKRLEHLESIWEKFDVFY
ncbi:MurR/RpiR family transcriptional regulator [Halobacillus kuroshimensis]|uniref:MurR/RpiR family transcriptional regulator n=1 Tax=Halobacillus kuroshimensis TaxID=302481 RepID=UPI0003FBADDF|nr:MurR/RpiR family transcriptional regulator [Halobacillus kuroshimensis]